MSQDTDVARFGACLRVSGALLAIVAMVAACSGSSVAVTSPPAAPVATTVNVTLQEFAVVPDVTSVPTGTVTFVSKNVGPDDVHEVVVVKSDLGAGDLPVDKDGKAIEDAPGVTVIGESGDIAVGDTKKFDFDLAPGKYILICNILQTEPDGTLESHYKVGMRTAFEVKAR